jgi:hypothetical protein
MRRTRVRRTPFSPGSEVQRDKVAGQHCLVCGGRPVDPAHLVPRSLGGCDRPECVVPLDRRCHRAHDRGELDLLPHLEPRYRPELAHGVGHVGVVALLRRVTGTRWVPVHANRHPANRVRSAGDLDVTASPGENRR